MQLSKDTESKICLDGKTQNTNEGFTVRIWERILKNTFVTLPSLEFGVYDAVSHFSIEMKASVLVYEKLDFVPGVYMLRIDLANQRACPKNQTNTTNIAG